MAGFSEAIVPQLDLFSINPYQLAIENSEANVYQPINTISDGNSIIEFVIPPYSDRMKCLDEIYLSTTLQLVKSDGGLYKSGDTQGFVVNSILSSMFRSAAVYFNNVLIVNISENFGIQEFLQLSLNFSSHVLLSKHSNMGFFASDEETKCKELLKDSKSVELIMKLNLFNSEKLLLNNVGVKIVLTLQNQNFFLRETTKNTPANTTANTPASSVTSKSKLLIRDLKLQMKHMKIRESYLMHIEKLLSTKNLATYEIKYGQVIAATISPGQSQVSVQNLWNGIRPSFLLMTILDHKSYIGDVSGNPLKFSRNDVSEFNFVVDSESYPKEPFEISLENNERKYARAFNALYSSIGICDENISALVDSENFLTNYFYLAHDLTSNQSSALTSLNEPIRMSNIGFNIKFCKSLSSAVTVLLYILLPRRVEIDSNRNVNVIY